MATYNTAFGSLPGYNEMLGTTNTTGGGQQQTYNPQGTQEQPRRATPPQAAQTFAQLQQQGMARPAPTAPQAQPFQQFGGSQQAQQMRQQLQQQLQQFGQAPSRFDTQAFQQIRSAQQANLQSEFQEQQRQLNEQLATRGLSASTIGAAGMGRLAGAQSRALADIDAQLLQRAAETQAADRAQLLQSGQGLAELAGAQDLQQFEANRVGQAAQFEQQLRGAEFGQRQYESGTEQAFRAAQAEQGGGQFEIEQGLRQVLGLGGLGLQERQQAAQEQQFGLSLAEQQAQRLQQFGVSQQEIGLRAQELQQRAALEGRQLSITEAQNQAQNQIEQQRIAQQAQQFGLTLNEQQAERMQRFGLSGQELALRAQEIQQRGALEGRQISLQEAQNLAQNGLEQQRINQQASQFGLRLSEDRESRLSQLGISQQQIALEQQRVANQAGQFGAQLSFDQARDQAQRNLEQQRINEAIATRTTGVQESALERALRERLQAGQLTAQSTESALERQLRTQLQATQGKQSMDELEANLKFQRERLVIEQAIAAAIASGALKPTSTVNVNQSSTSSGTGTGSGGGLGGSGGLDGSGSSTGVITRDDTTFIPPTSSYSQAANYNLPPGSYPGTLAYTDRELVWTGSSWVPTGRGLPPAEEL